MLPTGIVARACCTLCLLILILLTACSGAPGETVQLVQHSPRPAAAPVLPVPAQEQWDSGPPFPVERAAGGLTEYILSGSSAELTSGGVVPQGQALLLDPAVTGSSAEWALYRLNSGGDPLDSVHVLLDPAQTTAAFIGLANYEAQRWEFSGPFNEMKTLAADSADYLSPAGDQWVAVLVPGGSEAVVKAVSLRAISPDNLMPLALLAAAPLSGDAPLSVLFDASGSFDPDGSIRDYAWDFDGDGRWDGFTDGPLTSFTYTQPGTYSARLRVTDDQFAYSDPASIEISINAAPEALLSTDTPVVNPGATVFLNGSASYDPDGSIVDYEWDLDGNGVFNEDGAEAAAHGSYTAALVLPALPGRYSAALRVTDNHGALGQASISITVRGWLCLTVDAPGSVGVYSSLALVDGCPAISYFDGTNTDLKYAWSTEPDGSGGWQNLTVDWEGDVGRLSRMAVVSGCPAICYRANVLGNLKYAWSTEPDGSGGWSFLTVDDAGDVGASSSLAVVNGYPAISYYDSTNGDLKYAWSTEPDGSSGWQNLIIDPGGEVGIYSSLAIINGHPAVSYFDLGNLRLMYARCSTPDGSGSWTVLSLADTGVPGEYAHTSLAQINGQPAISYRDAVNTSLGYVRAKTAAGTSLGDWTGQFVQVDSSGNVGTYSSLTQHGGRPAVSYYDPGNGDLKFAAADTADGSGNWSVTAVDIQGNVGLTTSMAIINGHAAIAYCDVSNVNLKYAVLYE